jgi:hypothetical protein
MPRRFDGEGVMSNLIMTMLCVAAGSGLRFYQLLALLWWILEQKPRADTARRGELRQTQAERA